MRRGRREKEKRKKEQESEEEEENPKPGGKLCGDTQLPQKKENGGMKKGTAKKHGIPPKDASGKDEIFT
ncbi:hypothetical protein HMPREF1986_01852 [Oribacterium sp. oral taxon 078 str. F0263]|nr:hypothetical protein HMPREF1986_01852 [Oribacterium sp. oral taxon 078 str. F0263]